MTDEKQNQALLERARLQGRKLGLFIAALEIQDEEKEVIFESLRELDIVEIEGLVEMFEIIYIHKKTGQIDEVFRERVKVLAEQHQAKEKALLNDTLDKINQLTQSI